MTVNLLEESYIHGHDLQCFSKGLIVRFITNAEFFILDYHFENAIKGSFPHFGIAAREGIAILFREVGEKQWRNLGVFLERESKKKFIMSSMIVKNIEYECVVLGPILADMKKLSMTVDEKCSLIKSVGSNGNILTVGGRKTFGIGCSSQGFRLVNLLARKRQFSSYCLGYSCLDYLPKVEEYTRLSNISKKYDYVFLEVSEENQSCEVVREYIPKIIDAFIKYTDRLVLWMCMPPNKLSNEIANFLLNICNQNENIIYVDCSYVFDAEIQDMCTYSLKFVNDAGLYNIYIKILETMELKWNI